MAALWHHFAPWRTTLIYRPKSFSHVHLRRAADPELGCGPGRGSAPGRFGTASTLARSASESNRNPRSRFGLVWSPRRVRDVLPERPND